MYSWCDKKLNHDQLLGFFAGHEEYFCSFSFFKNGPYFANIVTEMLIQYSQEMEMVAWITRCITKQCMAQSRMCSNFGPHVIIPTLVRQVIYILGEPEQLAKMSKTSLAS